MITFLVKVHKLIGSCYLHVYHKITTDCITINGGGGGGKGGRKREKSGETVSSYIVTSLELEVMTYKEHLL